MEDVGGIGISRLDTPPRVDQLIDIAIELAKVVSRVHRRGVLHRNITPRNIVITPAGAVSLVDFALATTSAKTRTGSGPHTWIAGALAYVAPELTGRTSRVVDQRADLYALA
jgi:serine/threonine protein kinase